MPDPSFWQQLLARTPGLEAWLRPLARHALKGGPMPAVVVLGPVPDDKPVLAALESLFPSAGRAGGKFRARLDGDWRDAARWQPLVEALGMAVPDDGGATPAGDFAAAALRRLKVLCPERLAIIRALREAPWLARALATAEAAEAFVRIFEGWSTLGESADATLSELGARWLNDSKALRAGPLRQQLEALLRLVLDQPDLPSAALLASAGIVENPYTTHVVAFVPFAYTTAEGEAFDWPDTLWRHGEAAVLPLETVRRIATVRLTAPCDEGLVTSENAAPFHRLVRDRRCALYTEGYPNTAVRTLLRHLAAAGLRNRHWGDTDLDGYRIAAQVAGHIPTALFAPAAPPGRGAPPRIALTPEQARRLDRFLAAHPSFPYLAELQRTRAEGWVEQEQGLPTER